MPHNFEVIQDGRDFDAAASESHHVLNSMTALQIEFANDKLESLREAYRLAEIGILSDDDVTHERAETYGYIASRGMNITVGITPESLEGAPNIVILPRAASLVEKKAEALADEDNNDQSIVGFIGRIGSLLINR